MAMRLFSSSPPPPPLPGAATKASSSAAAALFSLRLRRARPVPAAASAAGGPERDGEGPFDRRMEEIAKKVPLFEPALGEPSATAERPLPINLELWLHRTKVHTRKYEFAEAEKLLNKCMLYWPEDGRPYVGFGKLYSKQSRFDNARAAYERGCQATQGENPYIWQSWAQVEMRAENNAMARKLFEKAVQASPKNRFSWHVWALFEANQGNTDKARKLFKIGHAVNPRDPVILQSLALVEYNCASPNVARVLFRKASQIDPRHQPVWIAWGWMEWKEGNERTARSLYQRALSVNSTNECAARCLQAWGVLEQRVGNYTAARRLLRSSLNINSQSEVTWLTWAALEEEQGDPVRAEEIRDLYFQQRIEVVDDASWVMGFLDIIDPALESVKKLLNIDRPSGQGNAGSRTEQGSATMGTSATGGPSASTAAEGSSTSGLDGSTANLDNIVDRRAPYTREAESEFDVDGFIRRRLALDPAELDAVLEGSDPRGVVSQRTRRLTRKPLPLLPVP